MKHLLILIFISLLAGSTNEQDLIMDIEGSLMAPCCWSGTVKDHGHSQLEQEIESMVKSGQTKDEILNYYVKIYGERILAVPVAQGFNIMAWLVPILIALIGITFVTLYLKSSQSKELQANTPDVGDATIPFDDQIEKELEELN